MATINDFTPLAPVSPAEILSDELKARGINPSNFAFQIGISASELNRFLKGGEALTDVMAGRLATALGTSANFWLELQSEYDKDIASDRPRKSLWSKRYYRNAQLQA